MSSIKSEVLCKRSTYASSLFGFVIWVLDFLDFGRWFTSCFLWSERNGGIEELENGWLILWKKLGGMVKNIVVDWRRKMMKMKRGQRKRMNLDEVGYKRKIKLSCGIKKFHTGLVNGVKEFIDQNWWQIDLNLAIGYITNKNNFKHRLQKIFLYSSSLKVRD